jgi:hypothetical protein
MALVVGIAIAAIQQLTGINIIIFYAPIVFEKQGEIKGTLAFIMSLLNFLATLGSVFFVDSILSLLNFRTRKKTLIDYWIDRMCHILASLLLYLRR